MIFLHIEILALYKDQKKRLPRRAFNSTSCPSFEVVTGVDFDFFIPLTLRARCNKILGFPIKVSRLITGCVCLLFNWFLVWNFCKEFSRLDSLRRKSLFLVEQGSFLRYFLPYSLWYVSSSAFIFKRPFCSLGPSTSTTPLMCLESSEGSPSLLNEWNELQKEHHISKSYTPSHLNVKQYIASS